MIEYDKCVYTRGSISTTGQDSDNDYPQASSIHAWHTVSTFQGRRGVLLSNPKDGKEISNPTDGKENEDEEDEEEEEEERLKCNNLSTESIQPDQRLEAQARIFQFGGKS